MKPWFQWPESPRLKPDSSEAVVIVGAGLAGSFLAATLAQQHVPSIVLDAAPTVAAGASGNPVAVVKPFVTREPNSVNEYYTDANDKLLEWLDSPSLAIAANFKRVGVLQLVNNEYPASAQYRQFSCAETSSIAGQELAASSLYFENGGWLNPTALCKELLNHSLIDVQLNSRLHKITNQTDNGWLLTLEKHTLNCRHLVLATGAQLTQSTYTDLLPITPARGQLSRFQLTETLPRDFPVITGKHYVIGEHSSIMVGATFERDNEDSALRNSDHKINFEGLRELLPKLTASPQALAGHAGVRATTPDRMPLVGPMPILNDYPTHYPDLQHGKRPENYSPAPYHVGLYVLGGFGSRGLTHAPLCASLLTEYLLGRTDALPESLHPARFCIANLKRAR